MRQKDPINWKNKVHNLINTYETDLTKDFGPKFVPKRRRAFEDVHTLDRNFEQQNQPFQLINTQNLTLTSPVSDFRTTESTLNTSNTGEIPLQLSNVNTVGPIAGGVVLGLFLNSVSVAILRRRRWLPRQISQNKSSEIFGKSTFLITPD